MRLSIIHYIEAGQLSLEFAKQNIEGRANPLFLFIDFVMFRDANRAGCKVYI